MRLLKKVSVFLLLVGSSSAVYAGCEHEGVVYDVGATICSNGWLMQCTPAGTWGTIGSCHHESPSPLVSRLLESESGAVLKRPVENQQHGIGGV